MKMARNALLAALFLAGTLLAGCSKSQSNASAGIKKPAATGFVQGKALSASFTDGRVAGMKGVAENDRLRLFVDDQKGVIAVLDKKNGEVWYSNPPKRDSDPLAKGGNKDLLSAQLKVDFYNNFGQINSINSYSDSVSHKQIKFETISNGVRATYQFGTAQKTVDDMPMKLSKARFDEITKKLDKTGQRALIIAYKEDSQDGIYARNDSALQGLQLERALKAFEDAGYTEKDLKIDIAALHLNQTKPEPRIFLASIEYTLDADSLIAKIPASSVHYPSEYPINNISLLSYFGAEGSGTEGSMFVPDGSGALIHFNNGKTQYPSYQQLVYGPDHSTQRIQDTEREQEVRLPVFGILRGKEAFLGIIEDGESVATINADISGRLNSYNYVYPSFYVVNEDKITLSANGQERSLPGFQENPMKSDFTVRYAFLSGEDASYQGMAKYYQHYLQKKKGLPEAKPASDPAGGNVPFYLQLVGSITKEKYVVGIPYQSLEPLTTFQQAESIVNQIEQRDIRNIKVKYSGWFNNGLDHKVPDHISVDGAVGGSKGLKEFVSFTQNKDIPFFPDVAITMANSNKGFNESRKASRTLRKGPAAVYPLELALNRRDLNKTPSYVVSPRYVSGYVDSMLKGLSSYKLGGISLRDMGDQLNSDFRKNNEIDRTMSEGITSQAFANIRDHNLKIMANGGNAYALPYVTDITNAPMSNSKFKLEDEEVPFYQMVIHGFIDYTGTPYNLSTYTNVNQYVLKCLEYGSGIYFQWIYEPNAKVKDTEYSNLYAVHYGQWIDQAAQIYKDVNGVLSKVQNKRMISHEQISNGVFKTVYENGVYVIVNYNQSQVEVDGQRIKAENYVTGGEQK